MKRFICPKCQYVGKPAYTKRGSLRTEITAWMLFPLGIPYTLWRMTGKQKSCKNCGYTLLIDTQSPTGMRLLAKEMENMAPEPEAVDPRLLREEPPPRIKLNHKPLMPNDEGW